MQSVGIVPLVFFFFVFFFSGPDHRRAVGQCEIGWDRKGKGMKATVWLYHISRNYCIPITSHVVCIQHLYFGIDHRPN
ncbi:hypothetical protein F5883DRAFT_534870 [Diaporthe sp. PMI_573]|nr:hypothetical protein F5883DRAFT_534870 [Diaporthaceae sp. PMI_573]